MPRSLKQSHVAIAAEAIAAAQFARCGCDVLVQYGANQPEYDLVVTKGDSDDEGLSEGEPGRGVGDSGRAE